MGRLRLAAPWTARLVVLASSRARSRWRLWLSLALPAAALGGPGRPSRSLEAGDADPARRHARLPRRPLARRPAAARRARALKGPGPFMGSRAIAVSPDGRHVYVASSKSDAIAIFARDPQTGALAQAEGKGGCIAAKGAERLRRGDRARRTELGRDQRRRPQRLRDLARRQLGHQLRPQPEDRGAAAAAAAARRLHLRAAAPRLRRRPGPARPRRRRRQPRRQQRLRRLLLRQRRRRLHPQPGRPAR